MSAPSSRSAWRLVRQVIVAVVLFATADQALRVYARAHFIPTRKLAAAVRAGDGCVVFSGGSDMQSALLVDTVQRSWQGSKAPCLADLALGGTSPDVRFMAFREYLSAGRRPSALVIGFKGHDVMDERELAPGYHLGNDATVYEWGTLADFPLYYPHLSFAAVDNAFRFLLYKASAIAAHRQTLWIRVDLLQQRLGLKPKLETNALGNVEAFKEIEAQLRTAALANQTTMRNPAAYRLAVWPTRLVEVARQAGSRVWFVRLPATKASERASFPDATIEKAFTAFMTRLAQENGGDFIDLSRDPWVDDALLVDALHYSPHGAELISQSLGRALAKNAPPTEPL
jgi:hypothetical protein